MKAVHSREVVTPTAPPASPRASCGSGLYSITAVATTVAATAAGFGASCCARAQSRFRGRRGRSPASSAFPPLAAESPPHAQVQPQPVDVAYCRRVDGGSVPRDEQRRHRRAHVHSRRGPKATPPLPRDSATHSRIVGVSGGATTRQ